jgi:hypothetical protein
MSVGSESFGMRVLQEMGLVLANVERGCPLNKDEDV